jgi:hypothetical protein
MSRVDKEKKKQAILFVPCAIKTCHQFNILDEMDPLGGGNFAITSTDFTLFVNKCSCLLALPTKARILCLDSL